MNIVKWNKFATPAYVSHLIRTQKDPISALRIFNAAAAHHPSYRHNGPIYALILDVLAASSRFHEMDLVLRQMKTDFCPCKDAVFAKAIRIYSQAGMLNDALCLFIEILGFNCINWTNSFNTLLQVLVDAGDLEGAYRLYTENSNRSEVNMQSCSFNLLISALCKVGRPRLAVGVFEEMCQQLCFPDRETYLILMRGLCDAGDLETTTHLLYSMFWRISPKGRGADIVVYRVLLEALCDCGRAEDTNMLLNKILKKGLKASKCHYKNLDIVSEVEKGRSVNDIKRLIKEALVEGSVPSSTVS